jgi:hypothetical protein
LNGTDVVLFENRTWHAGGCNTSGRPRIALMIQYGYRWLAPVDDPAPDLLERSDLTDVQRQLLGAADPQPGRICGQGARRQGDPRVARPVPGSVLSGRTRTSARPTCATTLMSCSGPPRPTTPGTGLAIRASSSTTWSSGSGSTAPGAGPGLRHRSDRAAAGSSCRPGIRGGP